MVTGSLLLDLSTAPKAPTDEGRDRRALAALECVPDGARVMVNIGDRRWPSLDAAIWLHHHADRLHLEIQGSLDANVRAWVHAVRAGQGWDDA